MSHVRMAHGRTRSENLLNDRTVVALSWQPYRERRGALEDLV